MKRLREKIHRLCRKLFPLLKRIFVLPPGAILILTPATMFMCIIALNNRGMFPVLEYFVYLVSAYALAVFIIGLGDVSRYFVRKIHGSRVWRWAEKDPIAGKMLTSGPTNSEEETHDDETDELRFEHRILSLFISDFRFRGELSLYQGLLMSTFFAVFKGAAAIFYQSQWFAAVAVYYVIFGVSRLLLVRNYRIALRTDGEERRRRELRGYQQCGCLMFLLNVGMAIMAFQLILEEHTIAYPGSVIYITAAYTFYILTLSVVNVVKFRRLNSPVLSASKALNLAGALMSLFTLQNALTSRFCSDDSELRLVMNSVVGIIVCLSVLAMAVYMLVHSTRELKKTAVSADIS